MLQIVSMTVTSLGVRVKLTTAHVVVASLVAHHKANTMVRRVGEEVFPRNYRVSLWIDTCTRFIVHIEPFRQSWLQLPWKKLNHTTIPLGTEYMKYITLQFLSNFVVLTHPSFCLLDLPKMLQANSILFIPTISLFPSGGLECWIVLVCLNFYPGHKIRATEAGAFIKVTPSIWSLSM